MCATICIYPSNVIYHVSSRYTLCILNIYFYYLFGNFPTVKNILQSMFLENIFSRIDIWLNLVCKRSYSYKFNVFFIILCKHKHLPTFRSLDIDCMKLYKNFMTAFTRSEFWYRKIFIINHMLHVLSHMIKTNVMNLG